MRKLIEKAQGSLVTCDNIKCGYTIPYSDEEEKNLHLYIDKACPNCGENLCTQKDYDDHMKVLKAVNWVNRWFSWVTLFSKAKPEDKDYKTFEVYTHKGVKITEVKTEEDVK